VLTLLSVEFNDNYLGKSVLITDSYITTGEVAGRWWSDATIASKILVPGSNPENC